MFIPALKNYFHPFVGRILFWNVVMLIFVKLILPHSAFQFASFINSIPVFDSREIIRLTNETRAANSLPVLKPNAKLDVAASDKLSDMATVEYFAHVSPTGVSPWYWMKRANYSYSVAGENLAIGFFTADETMRAWLDSPSHKANILNNRYMEIGVAAKAVEIGEREGILVVQMFGLSAQTGVPANTQNKPVVTPNAVKPIQIATVATPALVEVKSLESDTNLADTIQYVSTDITDIKPVSEPTAVQFENAKEVSRVSGILNNVFSIYLLATALLAATAFFLFEKSRQMAFKTVFSATLFILSIFIPVVELSFKGFIF